MFLTGLAWVVWWVDRSSKCLNESHGEGNMEPAGPLGLVLQKGVARNSASPSPPFFATRSASSSASCSLVKLPRMLDLRIPRPAARGCPTHQVVKLQKVERRKYVINPFSSVIFNPPPINDVKLQLLEVTEHLYKVGSGKGERPGFQRHRAGQSPLLRLKYDGGDWDQDMARGSDLNLLTEYGVRTGHPVSDRPEPIEISTSRTSPPAKPAAGVHDRPARHSGEPGRYQDSAPLPHRTARHALRRQRRQPRLGQ